MKASMQNPYKMFTELTFLLPYIDSCSTDSLLCKQANNFLLWILVLRIYTNRSRCRYDCTDRNYYSRKERTGSNYCLNQALNTAKTGRLPKRETCRSQTATDVVVRLNSPWAPGHFSGDSIVLIVVVVLLLVLMQGLTR